jgi:hypothetical protein
MTVSFYVKAAERTTIQIQATNLVNSASYYVVVDLINGSTVLQGTIGSGIYILHSAINVGNGWWRISLSGSTGSAASTRFQIVLFNNSGQSNYLGVAGSGVYVWGAQLTTGSVLQPYIPTTTAAINGANAFVTKWYDQSGNVRDAVQTTAASQPRIVNAGSVESENGKPSIFFDGTDDRLATSAAVITSTSFSTFSVFSSSSTVNAAISSQHNSQADVNRTVFLGSEPTEIGKGYIFYAGPSSTYQIKTTSSDVFNGTDSVVFTGSNNGLMSIGFRGVIENTLSAPAWTPLNAPLSIGSTGGATPSTFIAARIQELSYYPTYQTSYQSISSNMNTYYGSYWQGNGTALLDSFSGASAAYSLRNLSSAYTGPLIRVRRSSDNVERDIFGTFRGDLDLAALTSFVGANSGFVTTWYDQSGTGRHATQATAASQPRIVNAGAVDTLGGKPSVVFDGTNDFMSFADLTAPQFTSFYPQKKDANADIGAYFTHGGASSGRPYSPVIYAATGLYLGYQTNSFTNSTYQNINFVLISGYINASNQGFAQVNNVNIPLVAFTDADGSTFFNRINSRVGAVTQSKCSVPEMILYAFDNSANISAINNSINNYYKIY